MFGNFRFLSFLPRTNEYLVHWTEICHARDEEYNIESVETLWAAAIAWLFANSRCRSDSPAGEWHQTNSERPKVLIPQDNAPLHIEIDVENYSMIE